MERDIINKASNLIIDDGYSKHLIDDLNKNYPEFIVNYTSGIYFKNQISTIIDYISYFWLLDANSNNSYVSANLKLIANMITISDKVKVSNEPSTIDAILANENLIYTYDKNYDYNKSISAIFKTFLNIELNENILIERLIEGFKSILEKLTAYTTQIINNTSSNTSLNVYYNTSNISISNVGILSLDKVKFIPLELNYANLTTIAINTKDLIKDDILNLNTVYDYSIKENKLTGTAIINKDEYEYSLEPVIDGYAYKKNSIGI